jgi:protein-tyrosine phosphatase
VDEAALRVAVSVNPDYLETAFAEIRRAHGSLDNYLGEVLGVDAGLRETLQARLLE